MPTVPGGIAPPAKPTTHAQQTRVAGGHAGQFAAVCDAPDCTFTGDVRGTYDAAEADRKAHVAEVE